MNRFDLERAMKASSMPSLSKALYLVLCTHMNTKAGRIPDDQQPSLTQLCGETSLCRTTVRQHLYRLETSGWITTYPPTPDKARREHARTAYVLHCPGSSEMEAARARQRPADRRPARRQRLAVAQRRSADRNAQQLAVAAADEMRAAGRPVTPQHAAEIVRRILAGRQVAADKREVYLRKAIRANPRDFAPPAKSTASTSLCRHGMPKERCPECSSSPPS